jgi:DNA-binding CsgD family transcriptional regulator
MPILSMALLVAFALAFLSGPSAFLLLWLTYKRTKEASLRSMAFCILGLCLILLGNAASFVMADVLRKWDPRIGFLLMNEVFISAVMMGSFLSIFAHEVTRTSIGRRRTSLFWAFSILFFFLVLSLPIFLGGPGQVNLDHGYLASSLYVTICQAYSTGVIVRNRRRLPPPFGGFLPTFASLLLGIGFFSLANDFFHFGRLLRGHDLSFSPIFFLLINLFVIVTCAKELLSPKGGSKDAVGAPDFGLTAREREIIPLIVEGLTNEEIAERLFISPHTVKNHVTGIFRKAGVASRFELLKLLSSSPS